MALLAGDVGVEVAGGRETGAPVVLGHRAEQASALGGVAVPVVDQRRERRGPTPALNGSESTSLAHAVQQVGPPQAVDEPPALVDI